ncbi:uncharacterized protein [Globicephala melas]
MASQWTLSGEMTLKVQAILWQGDEAHRPWSQDAWAQISSFLSDIKSRTGPTHAGGGHPTWHSVSQADGDASDRVSSRQEFGPDPTGTQTWKKGKGHSVRTDVRAPSITQAAESPPRSVLTFPERLLALPRRCDGAGAVLLPPPCSPALSFWGEQRGHHIQTSHPGSAGWILVASGTKAQVSGEMSHLPLFRAPLLRKAVKGLLGASHELLNAFQNELALEREKGNLSG